MKNIVINKKANFRYILIKKYECGIVLKGSEIKAILAGNIDISDAYVIINNNEAFLLNAVIHHNQNKNFFDHDPRQTRKLLLHKKEILQLVLDKKKFNYTLIPVRVYLVNSLIKIEISLAKGNKNIDIKETIKKRDLDKINKAEIKKNYYKYVK